MLRSDPAQSTMVSTPRVVTPSSLRWVTKSWHTAWLREDVPFFSVAAVARRDFPPSSSAVKAAADATAGFSPVVSHARTSSAGAFREPYVEEAPRSGSASTSTPTAAPSRSATTHGPPPSPAASKSCTFLPASSQYDTLMSQCGSLNTMLATRSSMAVMVYVFPEPVCPYLMRGAGWVIYLVSS